jgi:hypothetical protein
VASFASDTDYASTTGTGALTVAQAGTTFNTSYKAGTGSGTLTVT